MTLISETATANWWSLHSEYTFCSIYNGMLRISITLIPFWGNLKSNSHVPENFCQIKVIPSGVQKILSFPCLVFKNENKWILKL